MIKLKRFFYYIFCGFFLGISAFAPGFSGSVMAITLGVYQDLVRIVSNPLKELRKSLSFFAPIALGIIISGIAFVLVFDFLFSYHIRATYLLFVGLIIGNLPVIAQEIKRYPVQKRAFIGGFLCFAVAFGLSLVSLGADQVADPVIGGALFIPLAISGFVAGAITLVPGMSISAILIMLGVYGQLISMVNDLLRLQISYLPTLFVVLFCAAAGLILTARLVKRLFERFPGFANTCVLGFMVGTLFGLFAESFFLEDPNFTWPIGIAVLIAGFGISIFFIILGKKMRKRSGR